MASSPIYRQESEMEAELKLALEEACMEAGVTLSSTVYPSVLLLKGDPDAVPAYKVAKWLVSTRKRTNKSYFPRVSLVPRAKGAVSDSLKNLAGNIQSVEGESDEMLKCGLSISREKPPTLEAQEITLQERLKNAADIDINSPGFTWQSLVSVYNTEHTASNKTTEEHMSKSKELTINSGGVVYFALFKERSDNQRESEETAAVLKFTPSRLITQSERLGYEFARHLGVCTPESRVIHNGAPEWEEIKLAAERCLANARAEKNGTRETTLSEFMEALSLSRCLLLMQYIDGSPLHENVQCFSTQKAAEMTAAALGRVLLLDLVLRNEDRLPCHRLGWRGNPANLLFTEKPVRATETCCTLEDVDILWNKERRRRKNKMAFSEKRKAQSIDCLSSLDSGGCFSDFSQLCKISAGENQEKTKLGEYHIVAIDSGVPRRPPAGKRATDEEQYPKLVELLLNDSEFCVNLLYEISGGNFNLQLSSGASEKVIHSFPGSQCFDKVQIVRAFRRSFRAAIYDMQNLQIFLLKLYRKLDMLLKKFILVISRTLPAEVDSGMSNTDLRNSPEQISVKESHFSDKKNHQANFERNANLEEHRNGANPCNEQALHFRGGNDCSEKASGQEGLDKDASRCIGHSKLSKRLTLKIKGFNRTAKVDAELSEELKYWNEILCREGQEICQKKGFVTGFLEGGVNHSIVDSYELKVRLEHVLERMSLISKGADTERPSCVLEHLYIGGALAAKSFLTLQHLGINHILCLCPGEIDPLPDELIKMFEYKKFWVQDSEDMDISGVFVDACDFIETVKSKGGKVLVHCFEGRSRSAAIVLAYLMTRKNHTLLEAWDYLRSIHRRAQPNDGFMRTLVSLDNKIYGKVSLDWQQKKPAVQVCPVCGKNAGISNCSLRNHLQRSHPGIMPPLVFGFHN